MSDQEAAKFVKQGLTAPITAFTIIAAIVGATVTATAFYISVNSQLAALSSKVISLEASDKTRDAEMAKIANELRADMQKVQISITGIETSLRFLVEAQRRRPSD